MMFCCEVCRNPAELRAEKEEYRYYICHACQMTYRTEEKLVSTEALIVTAKEKVKKYLETHKSPVTVSTLAKYFDLRETTIATALNHLGHEGLATAQKIGNKNFWQIVRARVAVPSPTPKDVPFVPQHVKQSSYAHVRGYDD